MEQNRHPFSLLASTENGLGPGKLDDGTIAGACSRLVANGIMEITDEEYE
jgi:hypothetical protein